ncbi:MAG: alpha/beta fold hydrolase [Pseudomonadota bacterium]|nr:alpha/beta fold hydrolase [Pseudomonadota bacterium]
MQPVDLTFPSLDGRMLAGTVHAPAGSPLGALVICSALGVPRPYYRRFATWMAARGVGVLTFDYRGVGGSLAGPLRDDPATLLDWGRLDVTAAIDKARETWSGLPLWALGHSFGGQSFGITPRGPDLAGAIVVAAGSGDLALYPPALRRLYQFQLGVALPIVTALTGYVPGRFGIGADLPAGVVGQWARWCRTPGYARGALGLDATHYHQIDAPMHFYDFPDDTFAPPAPSAELRSWYTGARVTHRTITPRELGLDKIGHFGFFRPGPTEAIWAELRAAVVGDHTVGHHTVGEDAAAS